MQRDAYVIEEPVDALIIAGQRHRIWVRSEPDADGTWHNALIFRRDGVHSSTDAVATGVVWHVPPGIALDRARQLTERDHRALYQRARRPRPPLA